MTIEAELLFPWEGAWRNPALWQALVERSEPLPAALVSRWMLESHIRPLTAAQAFGDLLDAGALAAAERLLEVGSFAHALAAERSVSMDSLYRDLSHRRARHASIQRLRAHLERRRGTPRDMGGRTPPQAVVPVWPYDEPPEKSCRMLLGLDRAYPGLVQRWAPAADDIAGMTLLRTLMALPGAQHEVDLSAIGAFSAALLTFLGGSGRCEPIMDAGLARTCLRGFRSSTVPALGPALRADGIWLVIPTRDASNDQPLSLPSPFLVFDPARVLRGQLPGALRLNAGDLFALLRDTGDRAARLLSILGAQLPPGDAVPYAWLEQLTPLPSTREHPGPPLHPSEIAHQLAAFFTDLAAPMENDDVIELLMWLAGGLPRVAWELAAKLATALGPPASPRSPISFDRVGEAWSSQDLRERLLLFVDTLVPASSGEARVLQVLLEDLATTTLSDGSVLPTHTVEDIVRYVGLSATDTMRAEAALRALIRVGLVVEDRDRGFSMIDGGLTWLLVERLIEGESRVESADRGLSLSSGAYARGALPGR